MNFIFDVDNTLYDQVDPFLKALREQCDIDKNIAKKIFYRSRFYSDEVFNLTVEGKMSLKDMHIYRMKNALKDFGIIVSNEKALHLQQKYSNYQYKIDLSSDMKKVFDFCQFKGYSMGIITNGPSDHQARKIAQLGVKRWIPEEHILVSGNLDVAKPDPKIFKLLERRMSIQSDKTFYIGDSFDSDIIGAKNAGWHSIWLNRKKENTSVDIADVEITDERDLLEEIKRLTIERGNYFDV